MNQALPPSPESIPPATPGQCAPVAPADPVSRPRNRARWMRVLIGLLAALALLLIAEWWTSRSEMRDLREDIARRMQVGDASTTETKLLVKSILEGTKELQAKVSVLESKQAETQSQQLALEQVYQDLSKNRDDWALAEIEQVLSTASQQLQLAGNVQGALIALQNADTRLSRSDRPQFITIRRAIAKDLDKLKALPSVDIIGIALRLDSAIGQVDGMPLLSDEKPAVLVIPPKNAKPTPTKSTGSGKTSTGNGDAGSGWLVALENKWHSWTSEMWAEISQLIRVRSVESPDALLLSPSQAYYARENLKLRLLNARLALLSRNESAFRSDLIAAQDAIQKYFDTRAKQTQTAQSLLKQVQGSNLAIEMPTLNESLNAVRNYKAKP